MDNSWVYIYQARGWLGHFSFVFLFSAWKDGHSSCVHWPEVGLFQVCVHWLVRWTISVLSVHWIGLCGIQVVCVQWLAVWAILILSVHWVGNSDYACSLAGILGDSSCDGWQAGLVQLAGFLWLAGWPIPIVCVCPLARRLG